MSADAEVEGATESKKPMKRGGSIVEIKVKAYSKIDFEAKREQDSLKRKSTADGSGEEGAVSPAFVSPSHESSQGSQQRLASVVSETENVVEEETGVEEAKEDEKEEEVKEEGEKEKEESEIKKKMKLHAVGAGLKKMKARFGRSKKGPTSLEEGNYEQVNRNMEAGGGGKEEEDGAAAGVAEGMVNGEGGSEPEGEKEEAVIEEELEEGVKIRSNLEKKVAKRFGGFNWVSISGKLKDSSLFFTVDKKEKMLDLSGCTVAKAEDSVTGLEVFSHLDQKQWLLRVESEALRDRWVKELQEAIDQCATQLPPEPGTACDVLLCV